MHHVVHRVALAPVGEMLMSFTTAALSSPSPPADRDITGRNQIRAHIDGDLHNPLGGAESHSCNRCSCGGPRRRYPAESTARVGHTTFLPARERCCCRCWSKRAWRSADRQSRSIHVNRRRIGHPARFPIRHEQFLRLKRCLNLIRIQPALPAARGWEPVALYIADPTAEPVPR